MPSTVGISLGPPPNTAPVCGGATGTPALPLPLLMQTPEKSLGSVPYGQAGAGAAVTSAPPPSSSAHAPAPRRIFTLISVVAPAGA